MNQLDDLLDMDSLSRHRLITNPEMIEQIADSVADLVRVDTLTQARLIIEIKDDERMRMIAKYRTGIKCLANRLYVYITTHEEWPVISGKREAKYQWYYTRRFDYHYIFWSFFKPICKPGRISPPIDDKVRYLKFTYLNPITDKFEITRMPMINLIFGPTIEVDGVIEHQPIQKIFDGHNVQTVEQVLNQYLPEYKFKVSRDQLKAKKFNFEVSRSLYNPMLFRQDVTPPKPPKNYVVLEIVCTCDSDRYMDTLSSKENKEDAIKYLADHIIEDYKYYIIKGNLPEQIESEQLNLERQKLITFLEEHDEPITVHERRSGHVSQFKILASNVDICNYCLRIENEDDVNLEDIISVEIPRGRYG